MTIFKTNKTNSWQTALINAVTQPQELLELLGLDKSLLDEAIRASALFPLKVPHSFIARMKKGDINDPLLQQVLPLGKELIKHPGYSTDPLKEKNANPIPGLLHKYHGRVLLVLTGNCGVNCRFCFRREFPYEQNNPGTEGWNQALDYISQNNTISEVILSGGDPLSVNDTLLKNFIEKIAKISHVKRLRIHSRMPIVLPQRVTPELLACMTFSRLQTILVLHCNHPQEINDEIKQVLVLLKKSGITLLNQSVLLKSINDNADTLSQLSETLFECGVLPYYLHVLDKVQGTAHFDLDLTVAKELHQTLAQRLPGYLVPKLVVEIPEKASKQLLE